MWWIALYLPQWPLEALGAPPPDAVEEDGQLICLGARAVDAGVRLGMSVPAAEVRLPGLQVRPRCLEQEARALRALALAVLRFSPNLHLQPAGLLIEVQASLRLFGGPLRLWQQMERVVNKFNVSAHLAAAPYPEAAWLLACVRAPWQQQMRRQGGLLGPPLGVAQSRQPDAVIPILDTLPVPRVLQAWGASVSTHQLLEGLGVDTLGAWRALPRAGLQRRLGEGVLLQLDRTYGRLADPRPFWASPPAFDERLELLERSTDLAVITPALEHLLVALEGWLLAQGLLASALTLHLMHEARRGEGLPDTLYPLRLAAPEQRAQALQRLWAERLNRQPLIAPVKAVRLTLQASVQPHSKDLQQALPVSTLQPGSQDPADIRQALAHLLDRLQARLGHQAVRGLRCQDDHRPERASRTVALTGDEARRFVEAASWEVEQVKGARFAAPLWLLAEPEPLAEHQGRPVHQGSPLVLRTRPERIEAGWFDGEPVCRDYQVAEGADHRLRWVFRESRGDAQGWFLHGWFS